jgi:hypothetical protein
MTKTYSTTQHPESLQRFVEILMDHFPRPWNNGPLSEKQPDKYQANTDIGKFRLRVFDDPEFPSTWVISLELAEDENGDTASTQICLWSWPKATEQTLCNMLIKVRCWMNDAGNDLVKAAGPSNGVMVTYLPEEMMRKFESVVRSRFPIGWKIKGPDNDDPFAIYWASVTQNNLQLVVSSTARGCRPTWKAGIIGISVEKGQMKNHVLKEFYGPEYSDDPWQSLTTVLIQTRTWLHAVYQASDHFLSQGG